MDIMYTKQEITLAIVQVDEQINRYRKIYLESGYASAKATIETLSVHKEKLISLLLMKGDIQAL